MIVAIVFSALPIKAALQAGALVKGPNSDAVYYIDGFSKHVFPDKKTYMTWFTNFNEVKSVSVAELDIYPAGAPMTYRAGTRLITHPNTARVYAVDANNVLHWVPSETCAITLYGSLWARRVQDVHEGTFSTYIIGNNLDCVYHTRGTLLQKKGETTIYYVGEPIQTSPGIGAPAGQSIDTGNLYQIRPFASDAEFILSGLHHEDIVTVDSLSQYQIEPSIKGTDIKDIQVEKKVALTADQSKASTTCTALGGISRLELSALYGEEQIFCSFGSAGECTQNELNSSTCFKQK